MHTPTPTPTPTPILVALLDETGAAIFVIVVLVEAAGAADREVIEDVVDDITEGGVELSNEAWIEDDGLFAMDC